MEAISVVSISNYCTKFKRLFNRAAGQKQAVFVNFYGLSQARAHRADDQQPAHPAPMRRAAGSELFFSILLGPRGPFNAH